MNSNQRRLGVNVTHNQGDGGLEAARRAAAELALEAQDMEFAPSGREFGCRYFPDDALRTHIFIIAAREQRTAHNEGSREQRRIASASITEQLLIARTPLIDVSH